MRLNILTWTFCIAICIVAESCNRYSNQLNVVPTRPNTVTRIGYTGGRALVQVHLMQNVSGKVDTIWASFQAAGGTDLDSVRVLIEACTKQENYDNCGLSFEKVISIPAGKPKDTLLLFANSGLRLADSFHVNVLSYKSASKAIWHPLGGKYHSDYIQALDANGTVLRYGRAMGLVDAEGNAKLRFKLSESLYYNLSGYFVDSTFFTGNLLAPNGDIISRLSLDSVLRVVMDTPRRQQVVRDTLGGRPFFRLKLETPRDNISYLFFQLIKL